jgi:hypothetical protein
MSGCSRKVSSLLHSFGKAKMMTFDYTASAELFIPKNGKAGLRQPVSFRRFATAAEAIRFAVEDFPAIHTLRAWMRVGDERFNGHDIQRLYDSNGYPQRRRTRKSG